MAIIVTEADVLQAVPTITAPWAQTITQAVNAEASRLVPELDSLFNVDALAEVKLVVLQAVQAYTMNKPWLASETTGPYSAAYRQRAAGAGVLTPADVERLREIAGQAAATPAGPLGAFPAPVSYDHLFWPPRSSW